MTTVPDQWPGRITAAADLVHHGQKVDTLTALSFVILGQPGLYFSGSDRPAPQGVVFILLLGNEIFSAGTGRKRRNGGQEETVTKKNKQRSTITDLNTHTGQKYGDKMDVL